MNQSGMAKASETILIFGIPAVSIFLITSTVTDPVNIPKMLLASGLGWACLFLILRGQIATLWKNSRILVLASSLFLVTLLNSVLNRTGPLEQTIYGTYGRNTGLLTYISMIGVLLLCATISSINTFKKFHISLLVTGALNVIYCAWVLLFGDFIPWSNQYGAILGFLGNPDFISAFLGIFIGIAISQIVGKEISVKFKLALGILSAIAFVEIIKSHAIQGVVVTLGGIAIVIFYLVRSRFTSTITFGYLITIFTVGTLAVLGTLQKGPLKFIYKRTVSLRGSYWHAGLEMGKSKPLSGVGLDTYGDWYRRTRPPVALVDLPGVHVTSNVAHNVVIDFFANGGYPLAFSYLGILICCLIAIFKITIEQKEYNPTFIGLVVGWATFQVQSLISINQIGLMIWGWAFSGLLIAYSVQSRQDASIGNSFNKSKKMRRLGSPSIVSESLIACLGLTFGLFVASPAYLADAKWRQAIESKDLNKVENALVNSYMNPQSSYKLNQAVDIMARSGLNNPAHKYALEATQYNPNNFDSWKLLSLLPNSTENEKKVALENMKRLDPLNPDVTQ
jgi:O-antigen ligase